MKLKMLNSLHAHRLKMQGNSDTMQSPKHIIFKINFFCIQGYLLMVLHLTTELCQELLKLLHSFSKGIMISCCAHCALVLQFIMVHSNHESDTHSCTWWIRKEWIYCIMTIVAIYSFVWFCLYTDQLVHKSSVSSQVTNHSKFEWSVA